ncbi:MAG: M23 family metallopeptidase [Nitrospiraceae bacterium]|nr:M23 family metallopeptidase [Nitrospiraceae bacterium]
MKTPQETTGALSGQYQTSIESLRGKSGPEAMKAVAKEMEALFAYEMLKAMREAAMTEKKEDFGSGAYQSLFDMEVARALANRGFGLQEYILRTLTRPHGEAEKAPVAKPAESPGLHDARGRESSPAPSRAGEETSDDKSGIPLPLKGTISSPFGIRRHPFFGDMRFHRGVDIAASAGTAIHPLAPGRVIFSGEQHGYGNVVIVDHGNGYVSKYGHNMVNLVKAGDEVDENTVIARVGSTGLSTGPHVHVEVRDHGRAVDPEGFLAPGGTKEIWKAADKTVKGIHNRPKEEKV